MKAKVLKGLASPFSVAAIYCGLGQREQALAWLEKACEDRDPLFAGMNREPAFDFLRSDPHFLDLMRRSTLPP